MILEARDISFSYERKGAELFSNINFKVEKQRKSVGARTKWLWKNHIV